VKYLISLLTGLVIGSALFFLLLYFNPFAGAKSISPLAVTSQRLMNLSFSSVASETLMLTNDGASTPAPHPEKVQQLWERTIGKTSVMVVMLADSRGETAGIGVKFSSESERTRVLNGELLVDSVWHIHLPGRGTMLVAQQENYWSYLRDIVIPAYKSSGDNWRGSWNGVMTVGPNALGTARAIGGSGEFAGIETEAVESRIENAFSVAEGTVAMRGSLAITLANAPAIEVAESE
jgi:hypothetical protein